MLKLLPSTNKPLVAKPHKLGWTHRHNANFITDARPDGSGTVEGIPLVGQEIFVEQLGYNIKYTSTYLNNFWQVHTCFANSKEECKFTREYSLDKNSRKKKK